MPCNNDLLAANFIDDGERIWLIDYEYSGNNDACFELGNIAGECRPSRRRAGGLVTAYYGSRGASRVARAQLFGPVSQYGWTLWGAIQHATSPLDFDFWAWAMERFEARRVRASPAAEFAHAAGRGPGRATDPTSGREPRSSSSAAGSSAPAWPTT